MSVANYYWQKIGLACGLGAILWVGGTAAAEVKGKAKEDVKPVIPSEATIPKSTFDVGASGSKDPFFPLSTRSSASVAVATNAEPAVISAKSFTLNGLSLSTYQSLAIINNRSLAEGERAMLTLAGSGAKIGVTVLKIKTVSVVVQVDGYREPMELFLPKTDR